MNPSPGFQRSIQAIRAVQDHGWTYPSNYLDIYFEKVSAQENISWMEVGEHALGSNGLISIAALGVFADVGLSNAARATLGQQASLATIGLHLSIMKLPSAGKIKAIGKMANTMDDAEIGAVFTEVEIYSEAGESLASGSALMGMAPFKNALNVRALPNAPKVFVDVAHCVPTSDSTDYAVYQAAQKALAASNSAANGTKFLDKFWGAERISLNQAQAVFRFYKGDELSNRSGNVHGGILYGMAAQAASAVASAGWKMVDSSVQYLNAASEEYFDASAEVLRQGRNTVVVECKVSSSTGKKIIHSQWTFLKPKS